MTGTHHHSGILRLLRGFGESFLATLTEWNASTFLGTKGDARVGLVDLDGSSDCFRAVRSENNRSILPPNSLAGSTIRQVGLLSRTPSFFFNDIALRHQ